ncbi:response regulator [Alkalihalobacillus pseudalcaliphilus]|uniref:response regulator n=1 Tax=Alkalihalobacillus pseudalcaliphilus TaxID=79884 RepID=UPI00064D79EF|nr:response regulator [Alkalihalobacillus pseudalcaliphilus]KMK77480.1 hypothetical protein AB990_03135 [Alkalihalobacillus pseudalcaliphilus]
MKALIIDDEKHVREGLLLLAEWSRFNINHVYEATNGLEAQAIINEEQPDIIFTDMRMPTCNGVELLKWLSENKVVAKTIVISGYDDFSYTKNAIKYGSFDYLLKPIQREELNETLEQAVIDIQKQKQTRLEEIKKEEAAHGLHPLYCSNWLTKLISDDTLTEEDRHFYEKEFKLHLTKSSFIIGILPMNMLIPFIFSGKSEEAYQTLFQLTQQITKEVPHLYAFKNMNRQDEFIILSDTNEKIDQLSRKLRALLWQKYRVSVPFVIGDVQPLPKKSYTNTLQRLDASLLLNEAKQEIVEKPWLLLDYKEQLKWAIEGGDARILTETLDQLFTSIPSRQLTWSFIKRWQEHFQVLQQHWLTTQNFIETNEHYWESDGRFSFSLFTHVQRTFFHALMKKVQVQLQLESNEPTIAKIARYIECHYQRDITLQEISDHFYLSREYISRKFKLEYKQTITDFLTSIRVQKAKELLAHSQLKIYEVAEEIGYHHDKYFAKVFKKHVGMTPSEYRQKHTK